MTCSVTKATPIQFIDSKSRIKKQRGRKTALSGYYTCLSHDLLLMASGWTHNTHIHQHSRTKQFQETRRACAWFNNFLLLLKSFITKTLVYKAI